MQEHLKIINDETQDGVAVETAAKDLKANFNVLKQKTHRDELRNLRSSIEKRLNKDGLAQGTKDALIELRTALAEHAIEEPLLPQDSGKKAAEIMPDILKPATETTVDAGNETLQRGYEEGKAIVKKVEKSEVYQEGKKRFEGFLEEAEEKGTITAVKDRMQDMWENGGAGGKILVATGLVAAGYLAYKAVSWLWEKLEEGSILAWGAVAGALGYGGYKLYQNREEAKKKEVEEAEAKKKAEAVPKQKDGSLPLEKLPPNTVIAGPNAVPGTLSLETGPNQRQSFSVLQEKTKIGAETLLMFEGKKYRFKSVPTNPKEKTKNLGQMVRKMRVGEKGNLVLSLNNLFPGQIHLPNSDIDIDVDRSQLATVLTGVRGGKKEVEVAAMFNPKDNQTIAAALKSQLAKAVKDGKANLLPDGRYQVKATIALEEVTNQQA